MRALVFYKNRNRELSTSLLLIDFVWRCPYRENESCRLLDSTARSVRKLADSGLASHCASAWALFVFLRELRFHRRDWPFNADC